jgi:hypothetical protein
MDRVEDIKKFYLEHLAGARVEGNLLKAPCPFCQQGQESRVIC